MLLAGLYVIHRHPHSKIGCNMDREGNPYVFSQYREVDIDAWLWETADLNTMEMAAAEAQTLEEVVKELD